jgi:hypothetical protein
MTVSNLNEAASVTLNASGTGTVTLGPNSSQGPATWHITGVILQTSRPGVAPIPRAQVWLDQQIPASSQGLSYDGSFAQGATNLTIVRGQNLICTWTSGQSGDVASMTVTGTKE